MEIKRDSQNASTESTTLSSWERDRLNHLIGAYEKACNIPSEQQIIYYYGDYGSCDLKEGIPEIQFVQMYQKALSVLGMTSEEYINSKNIIHGEVSKRIQEALQKEISGIEITSQSQGVSVENHIGIWYTIDQTERNGEPYFLMEHEKYGDETYGVILDRHGKLIADDVVNGFSDLEYFLENSPPIIGKLIYKDSGETIDYTDSQAFVSAYQNALDYLGPAGVNAEILTKDIETHYRITAAICDEFGETVDKDIYFKLANQYGFDNDWPKDIMYHGTAEDWEKEELKIQQGESASYKQRLFVDMDGTLAEFKSVDRLETLYEQGYFANLQPISSVVGAIKEIVANQPEVEVFVLSAYLSDSSHALAEKNQWLDEHLPEVDTLHRIFVPCGADKKEYVPEGIRRSDFLLDDYTHNLAQWEPPARSIKLLNGINHTKGTWKGDRIRFDAPSSEVADKIITVLQGQAAVYDATPQKDAAQAYALGERTAREILQNGYEPFYDRENLHIFRNPKSGGLQFYAISFQPDKKGQSKLTFRQLDTLESLSPYKHLMPPEMQQNLSHAQETRGIPLPIEQ